MRRPKQEAGHDFDDTGLFSDDQFQATGFIDDMEGVIAVGKSGDDRPARQRLEERREEQWLRQQLSDWDDLDGGDAGTDQDWQEDFEPRV